MTGPQGNPEGIQGTEPPDCIGASGVSGPQGTTWIQGTDGTLYAVKPPDFLNGEPIPTETVTLKAKEPKGCLVAFWTWWFRIKR